MGKLEADGCQWRFIDLEARLGFSSLDAVIEIYFSFDHTGLEDNNIQQLDLGGITKQQWMTRLVTFMVHVTVTVTIPSLEVLVAATFLFWLLPS